MALQRIYNAQVVTPKRILPGGGVECADGRITRVVESCHAGDIDLESCYLLPGLVDARPPDPSQGRGHPTFLGVGTS